MCIRDSSSGLHFPRLLANCRHKSVSVLANVVTLMECGVHPFVTFLGIRVSLIRSIRPVSLRRCVARCSLLCRVSCIFFASIRIKTYYVVHCYNWSLHIFIRRPKLLLHLGIYFALPCGIHNGYIGLRSTWSNYSHHQVTQRIVIVVSNWTWCTIHQTHNSVENFPQYPAPQISLNSFLVLFVSVQVSHKYVMMS